MIQRAKQLHLANRKSWKHWQINACVSGAIMLRFHATNFCRWCSQYHVIIIIFKYSHTRTGFNENWSWSEQSSNENYILALYVSGM